jgi:NAD(P)-dependent dehydrogenase (short-subunit alcohol dehydrogenase family)
MQSLVDKTAVITGAASGIGQATARSLAARGARVVLADLDEAGVQELAAELGEQGQRALPVRVDVGAEDAFEVLRERALAEFGAVDVVMNNVGVLTRGLPDHLPVSEWQRILNINLMSVVRSNVAFLPGLIAQGSGHLVNTASFAGLMTYSYDRLPYAASKAAIIQISEGLALYLKPKGIGVTVLCPGPVRTNIGASIRSFGPETETRGSWCRQTPRSSNCWSSGPATGTASLTGKSRLSRETHVTETLVIGFSTGLIWRNSRLRRRKNALTALDEVALHG